MLCATAVAAHDFEVGGIYYNITNVTSKTVEVTYKGTSYSAGDSYLGSVTIPSTVIYNGTNYNVTSIGENAFYLCRELVSVTIPNSIKSIKASAFSCCLNLAEIEIPSSVTSIGTYAFQRCESLINIVIPGNVKTIEYATFEDCIMLKSVTLPSSVTSIGGRAFSYCSELSEVKMGNNVTQIDNYAFYLCSKLTEITLPNSVTTIGVEAFASSGLESINLSTSLTEMGTGVFWGCRSLKSINIPNAVKTISENMFRECKELKSVFIGNEVTTIEKNAFYNCQKLEYLFLGKKMTTIEDNAFYYCHDIKKIFNSSSMAINTSYAEQIIKTTEISISGDFIFDRKNSYTYSLIAYMGNEATLNLPDYYLGYTYNIGDDAFAENTSLETINIPSGVKSIGDRAFSGCRSLISVEIPSSVTGIGKSAFYGCYELRNVKISNGLTSIGDDAFYYCVELKSIEIPRSVKSIGIGVFNRCSKLTNIVVETGNTVYDSRNCNAIIETKTNTLLNGCKNTVIPNNVTSISNRAFYYCSGLKSITIPACVTSIGDRAFYNCYDLTSITSLIPADKLFAPGSNAFYEVNCKLYIPYSAKETYASTEGWNEFANIVELEPTEVTVTIGQYGSATYCSPYALDFSNVEGLKAYAATGYNRQTQVVTLTRVQTAEAGVGLFLKGEPGEYVVPVIEYSNDYTLNLLVGTLEQTTVNNTDGAMCNYKFTIAEGNDEPMFYPFEDGTAFSAGKAYLQIPTAWLPATAQKSLSVRFDDGETTDIDELKGEDGKVKGICYDLSGRVVENPTSGIYIIDGKKVLVK